VPDLNKNRAEHEHEEDRDPLEDVVAAVEVGGADHFGVYPDENDEQEIHQGKHVYFCQKLSGAGSNSLYPLSLLKLVVLIYFSLL
jgi:hypothetical protein